MPSLRHPSEKYRKWNAFLSVSSSGPDYSDVLAERGPKQRPRLAAKLAYALSDVDFSEEYWRQEWQTVRDLDKAQEELHERLREPSRDEVLMAFENIGTWYRQRAILPDWDGGDLGFAFAGHGMAGDGSLCLKDGSISPDEFVDILLALSHPGRNNRQLRLNLFLDCCHSGAFLLRVLSRVSGKLEDNLYLYTMLASCMPDENAWETDDLGHGLFTFCFSHRSTIDNMYIAEAILPDNTFGPSLQIAAGGYGCSIVSLGRQNPVEYMGDGTGSIEVCGRRVYVPEGVVDENVLEQQIVNVRSDFLVKSEILRRRFDWGDASEDELRSMLQRYVSDRSDS